MKKYIIFLIFLINFTIKFYDGKIVVSIGMDSLAQSGDEGGDDWWDDDDDDDWWWIDDDNDGENDNSTACALCGSFSCDGSCEIIVTPNEPPCDDPCWCYGDCDGEEEPPCMSSDCDCYGIGCEEPEDPDDNSEPNIIYDCAGVANGTAYFDQCHQCVGGNTGKTACATPCEDFINLIKKVLNFEGGFVNDPNDSGGATNRGITWNTWLDTARPILGIEPTLENLKNLTANDAEEIYKERYWNKIKADDIIDGDIRYLLFDFYVNAGKNAVVVLQNTINEFNNNVIVDGSIGNQTINALNSINSIDLYNKYKQNRINYYVNLANRIPKNQKFLNGWKNRTNAFVNKTSENSLNVNCK